MVGQTLRNLRNEIDDPQKALAKILNGVRLAVARDGSHLDCFARDIFARLQCRCY